MSKRAWMASVVVAVAVLGAWAVRTYVQGQEKAAPGAARATRSSESGGAAGGAADNRPITVVTARVARRDVPIYLEGLGTVAPKTVTIRPRVEGQLMSVSFKEGQEVKSGTLLAQIDSRPFTIALHQAEAALARDSAQLRGGRLNLERYTAVRAQKLISQQQVDDQQASVDQLEAAIKADQAQIENARLQLGYARITAPIDGVTGIRLVDPGNVVHANDPTGIVIITQLDPIAVLFTLPQDVLAAVAEEMSKGPLTVVVQSRTGQTEMARGQVALIDNQINASTGTIKLKAVFPNPTHSLWPNQFVKARLLLTTKKDALVVPATTVQNGPRGTFVYVVGPDQKAATRPIEVASMQGEQALVARGLTADDTVIIEGQSQLRPGATVTEKKPEGAAPSGPTPGGGGRRKARP